MPRRRLHTPVPAPAELRADFGWIRQQFGVEVGFPEEVEHAATQVAARPVGGGRTDMREIEFFTVDPPGSLDLDQAMQLERRGDGNRVPYAHADVGQPSFSIEVDTEEAGRGRGCPRIFTYDF